MIIGKILWLSLLISYAMPYAKRPIVLWNTLALKDSQKATDKQKLQALEKEDFRIPGYMVPLESNPKESTEFIFVPSLPSCIHVPPPPPNQTIHVKMKAGTKAPLVWDPVWVEGRIKNKSSKIKDFGEVAYEMEADTVIKVKREDMNEINNALPKQNYVMDCIGRDKLDAACRGQGSGKKSKGNNNGV